MDEFDQEALKLAVNNAIWMNGPKDMTLEEAEEAAIALMEVVWEKEALRNKRRDQS